MIILTPPEQTLSEQGHWSQAALPNWGPAQVAASASNWNPTLAPAPTIPKTPLPTLLLLDGLDGLCHVFRDQDWAQSAWNHRPDKE